MIKPPKPIVKFNMIIMPDHLMVSPNRRSVKPGADSAATCAHFRIAKIPCQRRTSEK
jgi:hypothetical protein